MNADINEWGVDNTKEPKPEIDKQGVVSRAEAAGIDLTAEHWGVLRLSSSSWPRMTTHPDES